jgi:protein-disulfide isomerase
VAQANLKPFYWGLAVVALGGGAWIWSSTSRGGIEMYAEPLPAAEAAAAAGFAGYVKGSDSGVVEVHEYADFTCPACARFWVLTFPDVESRLIQSGQVRWVFHDRPLGGTGEHAFSYAAAHAAACSDEQGGFWQMHDQLFANQAAWAWNPRRSPEGRFRDYARAIGLDLGRYNECMQSGKFRARIQAEAEAADKLGISSTPTFVIGRVRVPRALPYDEFKRVVDSQGAASGPSR